MVNRNIWILSVTDGRAIILPWHTLFWNFLIISLKWCMSTVVLPPHLFVFCQLPASVTGLTSPATPLSFFPHFLIEEADFCKRRPHLSILAYVHSSISSVEKRKETRGTWASAGAYDKGVRMGVVFMVGRAKTRGEENIIQEESRRYHDIVQVRHAFSCKVPVSARC